MEKMDWEDDFESIKRDYNTFLDNYISLSEVLNFYDILEIDKLFEYLLKNGYIGSKNFELKNVPLLENKEILGANTFADGICRHKSCMLNDIYQKLNYDSTIVLGCFNKSKIKPFKSIITDPTIKKEVGEIEFNDIKYCVVKLYDDYFVYPVYHDNDFYEKIDNEVNHAIVLVGDKKRMFTDPTLYTKYYLYENDMISSRDIRGNYFFIWEPRKRFPSARFYPCSLQKTYNKIMEKEPMNMDEVIKREKEIDLFLDDRLKIIKEFINDNQDKIDNIKTKCLSLREKEKNIWS